MGICIRNQIKLAENLMILYPDLHREKLFLMSLLRLKIWIVSSCPDADSALDNGEMRTTKFFSLP